MLTLIAITASFTAGWWANKKFGTAQTLFVRSRDTVADFWNRLTK
jgi:hypothetical protein